MERSHESLVAGAMAVVVQAPLEPLEAAAEAASHEWDGGIAAAALATAEGERDPLRIATPTYIGPPPLSAAPASRADGATSPALPGLPRLGAAIPAPAAHGRLPPPVPLRPAAPPLAAQPLVAVPPADAPAVADARAAVYTAPAAAAAQPEAKEGAGVLTSALARGGGGAANALESPGGNTGGVAAAAGSAAGGAALSSPYASMDQSSTAFESAPATLMTAPRPPSSSTQPIAVPAQLPRPPHIPGPSPPYAAVDAPLPPDADGPPARPGDGMAAAAAQSTPYPALQPVASPRPSPRPAPGTPADASNGAATTGTSGSRSFPDAPNRASICAPQAPPAAAHVVVPPPVPEEPHTKEGPPRPSTPTNISIDAPSDPGSTRPGFGSGWFRPYTGGIDEPPGAGPGPPGPATNGYDSSSTAFHGGMHGGGDWRKTGPPGAAGGQYANAHGALATIESEPGSFMQGPPPQSMGASPYPGATVRPDHSRLACGGLDAAVVVCCHTPLSLCILAIPAGVVEALRRLS